MVYNNKLKLAKVLYFSMKYMSNAEVKYKLKQGYTRREYVLTYNNS